MIADLQESGPSAPATVESRSKDAPPANASFTEGIWKEYRKPRWKYDFRARKAITFYGLSGGPYLSLDSAADVYRRLGDTPFVSLYAATTAAEDLAELVTWHHLTDRLGVTTTITCTEPNSDRYEFVLAPEPLTESRRSVLAWFY